MEKMVFSPESGMDIHQMTVTVVQKYHLSFETLSICSDIAVSDIELLYNQKNVLLSMDTAFHYMCILMQLYRDPISNDYIPMLINTLVDTFHIDLDTLAYCCQVDTDTLNQFIKSSDKFHISKHTNIAMYVFHLYSSLTKTPKDFLQEELID